MTAINVIDPHLHLFDIEQGEYQWLKSDKPPFWPDKELIQRSFTENDLVLNEALTLTGFVHIEAGFDNQQPWREIAWLESHCQRDFRSIAGIDLTLDNEQFSACINRIKTYKSVVGVRDILDDNALEYLSSEQVKVNLNQLVNHGLMFELQMPLTNKITVDLLLEILKSTPELQVIINHAGFPPESIFGENSSSNNYSSEKSSSEKRQKDQQAQDKTQIVLEVQNTAWQQWQTSLAKLGQSKQCFIKCSGFEMINRQYQSSWQLAVINTCIEHFGIKRVMFGSNFPLCLLSKSYQEHWQNMMDTQVFTEDELNSLCYLNAKRIYKF